MNTLEIFSIGFIIHVSYIIFSLIDSKAVVLTASITKTENVEKIEDKDEYLNIRETVNQVKINKELKGRDNANNKPK